MKNITLILSSLLLIAITGCQKEEIAPYQNQTRAEIKKGNNSNPNVKSGNKGEGGQSDEGDESDEGKRFNNTTILRDTSAVITDPNRDEDEERNIKSSN